MSAILTYALHYQGEFNKNSLGAVSEGARLADVAAVHDSRVLEYRPDRHQLPILGLYLGDLHHDAGSQPRR